MAKINTLTEKEKDKFSINGKCDLCGETSEYYWCEDKCIEYCSTCAITYFPRMLADLVNVKHQNRTYHYPDQKNLMEGVKATYWRSIAENYKYELELNKIFSDWPNEED